MLDKFINLFLNYYIMNYNPNPNVPQYVKTQKKPVKRINYYEVVSNEWELHKDVFYDEVKKLFIKLQIEKKFGPKYLRHAQMKLNSELKKDEAYRKNNP